VIFRVAGLLAVGAVVVGGGAVSAYASAPTAAHHGAVHHRTVHHNFVSGTLYSQNDNDTGIAIVSQNFEAANDAFDAQGADDFTIPAGQKWKITGIDATGQYFNGPGPAASETVTFYSSLHDKPGKVLRTETVTGTDTAGSFSIPLSIFGLKGGSAGRRYWVSVQVNMDFTPGGEWGWETRSVQSGDPGMWQNPNDGFGTGCTSWGVLTTCIPAGEGPDFMYDLQGYVKV
jgi:hypothetical protein